VAPLHGRMIDAWMQHPTASVSSSASDAGVPLAATIEAMDAGGVRLGLVCAWWGPCGPLIDNDEVAAFVRACPDRLVGIASADLTR
jgi:hypothetical protein